MGLLDRLGGTLREGALDLFGARDELEDLREARADAKMLARRAQDVASGNLLGGTSNPAGSFNVQRNEHREQVRSALTYYFGDPVVRRGVDLITFFTLANGIPRGRYRKDPDDSQAEADRGQEVIDNVWNDEENKAVFFSLQAQVEKQLEMQAASNAFLVLHVRAQRPGSTGTAPVLKVSDLPETEITQIVYHPRHRKVPLYYRRDFTTVRFDTLTGAYVPGEPKTLFYADWRFDAPEDGLIDGVDWQNPPKELIAEGRVKHLKMNATSDMDFGVSQLASIIPWARGLNDLMTARRNMAIAQSQLAMQMSAPGSQRQIAQASTQLQELATAAGQVEGSLPRTRADQASTKVAAMNDKTSVRPMVPDTGAAGAATDIATMRGELAAGFGAPAEHLGSEGGGLANLVSKDGAFFRLIRFWQEQFRTWMRDIQGYALRVAGMDPDRLEQGMPPIADADPTALAAMFVGLQTAIDPTVANRKLVRFQYGEILDALGKQNVPQLIEELFGDEWKTPANPDPQPADSASQQDLSAAAGGDPAAAMRLASDRQSASRRRGRLRSVDERGGPQAARAQSLARAQARSQEGEDLREADDHATLMAEPDFELADELGVALSEAQRTTLARFDELFDGLLPGH